MKSEKNLILSLFLGLVVIIVTWFIFIQSSIKFTSLSLIGLLPPIISGFLGGATSALFYKNRSNKIGFYLGLVVTLPLLLYLLKNGFSHLGRNPFLWYWPMYILPSSILGAYIIEKYKKT